MKTSFWKALESLGASGAARHDWMFHLGPDWSDCARFLKPTGQIAWTVIDPRLPFRRLSVGPDQIDDYVGYDEEDTSIPPVPFSGEAVAEFAPDWKPIVEALAPSVGFDHGVWEVEGSLRRVGTLHTPGGEALGVLLYLPSGSLFDHHHLFIEIAARFDATVLVPSARWVTAELELLGQRNRIAFLCLKEHLSQPVPQASPFPHPRRKGASEPTVRVMIRGGNGLKWSDVRIEVGASRRIFLFAPGQEREYTFSPSVRIDEEHALGMLMKLAAVGEWKNPPFDSPDYLRVSKAFLRLRKLLKGLVSLPGEPFRKHRGAYLPAFQISLKRNLLPENMQD